MGKNTPSKRMSDAEIEGIREHYRQVILQDLVPASLMILEGLVANGGNGGKGTAVAPEENERGIGSQISGMDADALIQYCRRQRAKRRLIVRGIRDVLDACRGKVGKTISKEDFRMALDNARQRGLRKAGSATDDYEAPKAPSLSEPK